MSEETSAPVRDLDLELQRGAVHARLFGAAPTPPPRMGRFAVLRRLGAGGMGVVYEARDAQLDRRVALKLLQRLDDPGGEGTARLLREAQALARLSHPNVVQVHDVGEHEGRVFLTMEFVAGPTLRAWQAAARRGWRAIVDMYKQAGEGLAAAHDAGLVHRDFKPENVLVAADGRPRVLDFGLASLAGAASSAAPADAPITARVADRFTRTGARLGTPGYAAPELRGGDVTPRADQYSFCVSLYEALHGSRPGAPGERDPSVPAFVDAALTRGLDVDPARRFDSMRALLEALGRDPTRRRRRRAQQVIGVLALAGLATALWIGRDRTRALVEDREARAAQAQAQARRADEEARREADRARDEADRADATRLVALARARLGDDPTYGLLLAAQAVALLEARGEPPLPVAEQALRDALDAVRSAPLDQGAAPIERLALTTGGEQIATARRDGGVTLWRLDDAGRPRPRPLTRARTARALGLDFSPRGDALVVTDADGGLSRWRLDDGDAPLPAQLEVDGAALVGAPLHAPAHSHVHEDMLIARADEAVARIDLSAPEAIAVTRLPAPAGPIAAARESPDGRLIAAAARDVALLWRADSGALARTLRHVEGRDRAGPPLLITDLDFSPDSAQLLTAASDGVARRYPTAGGRPTLLRGHAGGLRLARFTAGGEQIVTVASDGVARAWELGARPRPLPPITLRALTTTIGALRHAARTNMLLGTPSGGAALLWSLDGVSEPTQLHGHTGSVVAARFDPSGEALATGSVDGSARLWSWATSPEVLRGHAQAAQQVTFLPGGALLSASLDGTARRWRPSERGDRRVTILAGHREGASVLARVSPDGDWIVTASADGSLLLWTGEGARASDEAGARVPGEPVDLALDRRGRVAVGTREGAVHLLRVAPAGRLRAGPRVDAGAPITRVRLAGDALLATTEDGRVQAWTLADDAPTPGLTRQEHAGAIRDLDVDVAGRRLVTAGDDGIARVLRLSSWEVDATVEVTALRGHEGPLWSARLDASGERLLTASSDGTARLWMTSADAPATILRGHTAAVWIALFDPAGTRALTSSADGTARLWSLPAGTSILLPHAGTAAPGERDVSVWSAAFSPDGALAATADDSGVIRLFPVAVEALLAGACLRAGRALTRDEWRDALGDRPYAPACR